MEPENRNLVDKWIEQAYKEGHRDGQFMMFIMFMIFIFAVWMIVLINEIVK